jgi:hypothetical protein
MGERHLGPELGLPTLAGPYEGHNRDSGRIPNSGPQLKCLRTDGAGGREATAMKFAHRRVVQPFSDEAQGVETSHALEPGGQITRRGQIA